MICKLALLLMVIFAFPIVFYSNSWVIYINESNLFRHNPRDTVYLSVADGYVVIRVWSSRFLNIDSFWLLIGDNRFPMKIQFNLTDYSVWFGYVSYNGSGFKYFFEVKLSNGSIITLLNDRFQQYFVFDGFIKYMQVSWVGSRVGYQIFPDRFYNGDPSNDDYGLIYDSLHYDNTTNAKPVKSKWNDPPLDLLMHCCHQYYGGDLRGVIEKLDYLKELGVGLIYLNPIFLSGSVHGYDTYDHFRIHPMFGTLDDVKKLLEEAHKRDIKVIFDFVPGHVGLGFWAFQDVYVNGPNSRYWDWFTIYRYPFTPGDGRDYKCWEGIGTLPQLNVLNPEVKKYLFNAVMYWFEIGFDGVRIDTPLYLPENYRLEFFHELRDTIKSRFPEAYIVGEIWFQAPDWVNNGPFDSLMNYALGMGILLDYAQGKLNGVGFNHVSGRLADYFAKYSVSVAGMGFNNIGTHDTDRTLTMLGGGGLWDTPSPESILRLKMLSTLQYMMPGVPVIFQGDERGYTGRAGPRGPDEQRYTIQWDRLNTDVYNHYRYLGWIKNNLKPLHTSIIRVFDTSGSLLVFTRGYNDEVLVVANNDRISVAYELPPGEWSILYVSSGEEVVIRDRKLIIPPLTAIILVLQKQYSDISTTTEPEWLSSTPVVSTPWFTESYQHGISTSTESPVSTNYLEERSEEQVVKSTGNLLVIFIVITATVVVIVVTQIILRNLNVRV
uniref:Glycoside hydrolase family 13 protein n=1 Tax=Staphylothermus marinus TaxID=2280 RepID=A0A7J3KH23_STAMA